jgi:hypothetical protein
MDLLITFILPGVLFLALEVFWCRPAWLRELAGAPERRPGAPELLREWDPFALPLLQQRMDELAAELERLDDDPVIFAKAFRTHVAQAAYQAVLAEAIELANASRLATLSRLADTTIVDVQIWTSLSPHREELEV